MLLRPQRASGNGCALQLFAVPDTRHLACYQTRGSPTTAAVRPRNRTAGQSLGEPPAVAARRAVRQKFRAARFAEKRDEGAFPKRRPVGTIPAAGSWSSRAFMAYLDKQVVEKEAARQLVAQALEMMASDEECA